MGHAGTNAPDYSGCERGERRADDLHPDLVSDVPEGSRNVGARQRGEPIEEHSIPAGVKLTRILAGPWPMC